MNIAVLAVEIVVVFTALTICHKLFGKAGAIAWVGIATVLANIITAKNADIGGMSVAIGTVMFASTFLATDILAELYGEADAKQAVYIGLFADIILIVATQIALWYTPSEIDYADGAMRTLFSLNLRISLASMVMYFVANIVDVKLFCRMKEAGSALWVRNNVATIICNCLENLGFIWLAFAGVYDLQTILIIALSTSAVEFVVALCDTPFLYLARRLGRGKQSAVS